MSKSFLVTSGLYGRYRDVIRDREGRITHDSGWVNNTIVVDCRRLLAGFMRGAPATAGIQGLQIGAGLDVWDQAGAPPPAPAQVQLVDPNPHTVPLADLQIDFLDPATGNVSAAPTNSIQIVAQIGPGVPPWPDANHASATLREFGLVAELGGNPVLINSVRHPAIPKDPASTLDRTIWLIF